MKPQWSLKITRTDNGYYLQGIDYEVSIQEKDDDELSAHENLLWEIMEYFNFIGSKHDSQRLRITREDRGD